MIIAVTGAAGGIGRHVVAECRAAGHEVLALDRRASAAVPEVTVVDLTDPEATMTALAGAEAIVHLAAIPGPRQPNYSTFDPNILTTYHVLEAARAHGCRRLAMASSIWAYGYNAPAEDRLPPRLPLDEAMTIPTVNCYGLSKRLLEHLGAEYAAAAGMQVVCMRYPWVTPVGRYPAQGPFCDDAGLSERAEAWSYVDVRDVATACRLAVERSDLGFVVLNIGAADTKSLLPSAELVARHRPDAELVRPVSGHEALYAIDRARAVLGYNPRHSWRQRGATPD